MVPYCFIGICWEDEGKLKWPEVHLSRQPWVAKQPMKHEGGVFISQVLSQGYSECTHWGLGCEQQHRFQCLLFLCVMKNSTSELLLSPRGWM